MSQLITEQTFKIAAQYHQAGQLLQAESSISKYYRSSQRTSMRFTISV